MTTDPDTHIKVLRELLEKLNASLNTITERAPWDKRKAQVDALEWLLTSRTRVEHQAAKKVGWR